MTMDITRETKTKTMTTMMITDQDPIVKSLIWLRRLAHASVLRRRIGRQRQLRCGRITICIYVLKYIKPINNNMCYKMLYSKNGVLELCFWNIKNSWIIKRIDYIFDIYYGSPLIVCPYFSLILTGRFLSQPIAKDSNMVS